MKKLFVLSMFILGTLNTGSASAAVTCNAGPCGNGTSCSATGSQVTCSCVQPFFGGATYAHCSNAIIIPEDEEPVYDPTKFSVTEIPNAQTYEVHKK